MGVVFLFKKHKRTSLLNRTLKNKATEDQEQFEKALESKNKQLTLLSLEAAQQTDLFKKNTGFTPANQHQESGESRDQKIRENTD
ncbi:MAG: hypothetical protein ACJATF_004348 [Flavobacteriales bacterium]|jgi:hypothetical protein